MVKFPGGSPGRWEKIAHELGRSVTDVSVFKVSNLFEACSDPKCDSEKTKNKDSSGSHSLTELFCAGDN